MTGTRVRRPWRPLGWLMFGVGVTLVLPHPEVHAHDGVTVGPTTIITEAAAGSDAATFPYDVVAHDVVQHLRPTPALPGWEGFPYVEGAAGSTWVGDEPDRADARGLVALAARHWRELDGLSGIDEWLYDFGDLARAADAAAALRTHGRLFTGVTVHEADGVLHGADHVFPDGGHHLRQYWVLVVDHYVYVLGLQAHTPMQWWATLNALSQDRFGIDVVHAGARPEAGRSPDPVAPDGAAPGALADGTSEDDTLTPAHDGASAEPPSSSDGAP